jgi:putative phosphoesterase
VGTSSVSMGAWLLEPKSVQIGIISDIHAEWEPLNKALALFDGSNVDHIVCAGDLVDGGWDEERVIDTIRQRDIPTVQGNHDRESFTEQAWLRHNMPDDDERLIESYRVAYLSSLPLTLHFDWEGVRVCLAHATPWSNTEYLFPHADVGQFQKVINTAEADVVIVGHTHTPMHITIGDKHIVNPGSLYVNRTDRSRTCGLLTLPEITFQVFDVDTGLEIDIEKRDIS